MSAPKLGPVRSTYILQGPIYKKGGASSFPGWIWDEAKNSWIKYDKINGQSNAYYAVMSMSLVGMANKDRALNVNTPSHILRRQRARFNRLSKNSGMPGMPIIGKGQSFFVPEGIHFVHQKNSDGSFTKMMISDGMELDPTKEYAVNPNSKIWRENKNLHCQPKEASTPKVTNTLEEIVAIGINTDLKITNKPKKAAKEVGVKHDQEKPQASLVMDFGLALTQVAKVCTFGAKKYGVRNWLHLENGEERCNDAAIRHLLASTTEELDPESGMPHTAHLIWNLLASMELKCRKAQQK